MQGGFLSTGVPLGHIAGIQIRLHWTLLAYWFFELNSVLRLRDERGAAFTGWLLAIGLMFGSILLHELGHAFAARRVGGDARDILLWPLGGLAFCESPPRWTARLAVAIGGPLVTVTIFAVSYGV